MKGLIYFFAFALISLVSVTDAKAVSVKELKLHEIQLVNGLTLSKLTQEESSSVLNSLELDENIEIRDQIIYPVEIKHLISSELTKVRIFAKRPNQNDYN